LGINQDGQSTGSAGVDVEGGHISESIRDTSGREPPSSQLWRILIEHFNSLNLFGICVQVPRGVYPEVSCVRYLISYLTLTLVSFLGSLRAIWPL